MTPTYARKGDKRYRYYLSSALSSGQAEQAASVSRVPAIEIERHVVDAVRKRLKENASISDRDLVHENVGRVEVHVAQIVVKLERKGGRTTNRKADNAVLYIPWKKTAMKRRREIIAPARSSGDVHPIGS